MKNPFVPALLAGLLGCIAFAQTPAAAPRAGAAPAGPAMALTSPAFPDGGEIPHRHTQVDPAAVSPRLDWTNVPAGTVSFTLHMRDLDVSVNRTTEDNLHWLVFNIPGDARSLPEGVAAGTLANGTMQVVGRGGPVYRGPGAPATGPRHHYAFELYALDAKLDLPATATRADVLKALDGHILGKAVYVGLFRRPAAPAAAPAAAK